MENFLPVIDKFVLSLQQRQAAYSRVCSLSVFLHDLDSVSAGCIEEAAAKVVSTYKSDLNPSLGIELIQFSQFLKLLENDQSDHFS